VLDTNVVVFVIAMLDLVNSRELWIALDAVLSLLLYQSIKVDSMKYMEQFTDVSTVLVCMLQKNI